MVETGDFRRTSNVLAVFMSALTRTLGTIVMTAVLSAVLQAQAPEPEQAFTFRSDTRLVDLHATVVDKQGHLVLDLPQSAFTVYENGVKQDIKVFRREDAPVSM